MLSQDLAQGRGLAGGDRRVLQRLVRLWQTLLLVSQSSIAIDEVSREGMVVRTRRRVKFRKTRPAKLWLVWCVLETARPLTLRSLRASSYWVHPCKSFGESSSHSTDEAGCDTFHCYHLPRKYFGFSRASYMLQVPADLNLGSHLELNRGFAWVV